MDVASSATCGTADQIIRTGLLLIGIAMEGGAALLHQLVAAAIFSGVM